MDKKVKVTYDVLKAASEAIITDYVIKHMLEVPESLKAELDTICNAIIKTVVKKNADYGDAWQRYGMFTGLIRENDKLLRVETLADGRQALVADEKVGDTLVDIVGYGLLLKLWMDGQEVAKPVSWVSAAIKHWNDDTASDGVDIGTDGDTTVYRIGNRIYTEEEFNTLRPNRQPELPFAATEEEGVIHKIVEAEHDVKIYEHSLMWHGGAGVLGAITEYSSDGGISARTLIKKDISWRKDELGLRYIYESDLDIKWEPDNDPNTSSDVA
jgi:hypothetical protein